MNQMPGLCLPASQPGFTPKQGQYLAFIHRLHAGARPAAGRSRFATILPGDAAFSPPDGAHARTQRPDPPSARHRSEHQGVGRSRSTAALTRQLRSTRQILCAELLVSKPILKARLTTKQPSSEKAVYKGCDLQRRPSKKQQVYKAGTGLQQITHWQGSAHHGVTSASVRCECHEQIRSAQQ
jgi:hypothetical protein